MSEGYWPRHRVPLDEARRLWRRTDLFVVEIERHVLADPDTGMPIEVEFERQIPAIITPELLGWTRAELIGDIDAPEGVGGPPTRPSSEAVPRDRGDVP